MEKKGRPAPEVPHQPPCHEKTGGVTAPQVPRDPKPTSGVVSPPPPKPPKK